MGKRRMSLYDAAAVLMHGAEGPMPYRTLDALHLPDMCADCGDAIEWWNDPYGVSRRCGCDFGYVSDRMVTL